jgi:TonB-dependent receptor
MGHESQFQMFRDSGCWPQMPSAADTRDIVEDDDAYYLQLDFVGDIAGMDLRGNVGVREVTTNLKSTGMSSVDGSLIEITATNKYTDTLPAMNLALDINDELVARFGWAKVMSRPDISFLSPGGSITTFGVPAVSYNNPVLEPYRADNLDVGLEWYFADDSVIALAYFERDIESFPTTEGPVPVLWTDLGLPDSLLGAQVDDLRGEEFQVTRRVNGGGARLDGWEIQYQQQFAKLPGLLANTGIIANYTWVDSAEDGSGLALTGQSDDSYNFTVYYEDDKVSARVAYSYRGEYNTTNSSNENSIRYRADTANLDFSASYQINDSLRVTLEGINLTDEPQIDWMSPNVGGRLIETQYTGTVWFLGASYKYQ